MDAGAGVCGRSYRNGREPLANRKTTNVVSADVDLLEVFKRCIPRAGRIGRHSSTCWHVTVSSVDFYRWLQSIGLTPAKSLTLGGIEIDDAWLIDLARGLLDGDGSIENYIHHPAGNVKRYPTIATSV